VVLIERRTIVTRVNFGVYFTLGFLRCLNEKKSNPHSRASASARAQSRMMKNTTFFPSLNDKEIGDWSVLRHFFPSILSAFPNKGSSIPTFRVESKTFQTPACSLSCLRKCAEHNKYEIKGVQMNSKVS
jgi:hypothetical protein